MIELLRLQTTRTLAICFVGREAGFQSKDIGKKCSLNQHRSAIVLFVWRDTNGVTVSVHVLQ